MTIKRIDALGLGEVLGSMLGSVIDAQAQSARATVAFIEDVGFETTQEGDKLRTVKLLYTKRDENNEPTEFLVEMPLLAMVNVPSLAVKEAKLSFSYDIVVATGGNSGSGTSERASISTSPLIYKPAKLKGFVRSRTAPTEQDSTKKTAAIDLDITLAQQEVPVGVERLFDLAELGIIEDKSE